MVIVVKLYESADGVVLWASTPQMNADGYYWSYDRVYEQWYMMKEIPEFPFSEYNKDIADLTPSGQQRVHQLFEMVLR